MPAWEYDLLVESLAADGEADDDEGEEVEFMDEPPVPEALKGI